MNVQAVCPTYVGRTSFYVQIIDHIIISHLYKGAYAGYLCRAWLGLWVYSLAIRILFSRTMEILYFVTSRRITHIAADGRPVSEQMTTHSPMGIGGKRVGHELGKVVFLGISSSFFLRTSLSRRFISCVVCFNIIHFHLVSTSHGEGQGVIE